MRENIAVVQAGKDDCVNHGESIEMRVWIPQHLENLQKNQTPFLEKMKEDLLQAYT